MFFKYYFKTVVFFKQQNKGKTHQKQCNNLFQFSRATITMNPKLLVLKNRGGFSHSSEGCNSRSRWQGQLLLRAIRENLSQTSQLLETFGIPQLADKSPPSLPLSQGILPIFLSVSKFPLFTRTPVLLDSVCVLPHYDLI